MNTKRLQTLVFSDECDRADEAAVTSQNCTPKSSAIAMKGRKVRREAPGEGRDYCIREELEKAAIEMRASRCRSGKSLKSQS